MAISNKVDYEVTKTFTLKDPDGNDTPVKYTVKSDKCAGCDDVNTKIAAAAISLQLAIKDDEDDEAVTRWLKKQKELQCERIFLCTVSIDWNGEEWEKGDGGLELTQENLSLMLEQDWVAVQFQEAIKGLGDFTKK